jgi:threonine efflux protein
MLSVLFTIFLLHWAVLLTPGANFLLVGQLAASGRRSTACAAAFGVTTVTITWATLAILGIGLIFSARPLIRQVFQVIGGAYLGYLGLKLWQSQGAGSASIELNLGKWAAFRLGFFSNMLNPKTALFFCSVFGAALPANPGTLMATSAVALVYLNAVVWHLFLALAFSHPQIQAGYNRYRSPFNKVSGVLMGGFGLKLLLSAF